MRKPIGVTTPYRKVQAMDNVVRDWDNFESQRKIATGVTTPIQEHADQLYAMGWNAALEYAAMRLVNEHKHAFGPDTMASVAVWIKGMRK
jgi:hypothetical protein